MKRFWRISALIIGSLAGLLIAFYLMLLAINWRDKAPSAAVTEIHRAFDERPEVPVDQNAYVYASGFTSPNSVDPVQWGEDIIGKSKLNSGEVQQPFAAMPTDFRVARSPELNSLIGVCEHATALCVHKLEESEPRIAEWVGVRALPLSRYAELKRKSKWQEAVPSVKNIILPPFAPIMDAQRMMLIGLWHRAPSMRSEEIRDALDADFRFWRLILANADTLITKMIAVVAMQRSLALGELTIRRLDSKEQLAATPDSWSVPLSRDELSMLRVMRAEALYSEPFILQIKSDPAFNEQSDSEGRGFGAWVESALLLPLFQPQDTVNNMAEYRIGVADRYRVPLDQYPAVFRSANEKSHTFTPHLYNPIGYVLHATGESQYDRYVVRVSDLEGMRRAVLLTVQLRGEGLDVDAGRDRLKRADLKNPYTETAFGWSESDRGIAFVGLEPGARGRHVYSY